MTKDDDLEFETEVGDVDPKEHVPIDRVRKNVWFQNSLIKDLEDIVKEDDSNLTAVIRKACKNYVRARKGGEIE